MPEGPARWTRPGRGEVLAFVLGTSTGFLLLLFQAGPVPLKLALTFLSPAYWLAAPFLAHILPRGLGLFGALWAFIVSSGLINGLLYALFWYLGRLARQGSRAPRFALVVGGAIWAGWVVTWSIQLWPKPPAPVDFSSPLVGRWEGVGHGATRDFPVTLICHPRTDGTLDGLYYASGDLIGPIEEGTHAGDSLQFHTPAFHHFGHRDGTSMTLEWTSGRRTTRIDLRFAHADTARVPGIVQKY